MATALGDRLRARIRQDGPLPFAEWMDACLYDPDGGFYTQAAHPAGTGPGSDFATSPALHPFFAECVARELADAWRRAGSPARWTVAEFGAGTGALARDAAAALRAEGVPVDWVAIDVRAGPPAAGVRWAEQAPAGIDAAVANEFLDAVPFDLHEWQAGQWWRVGVGLGAASTFAWARLGPSRVAMPPGRDGERRVVMPAVPLWVRELARLGARCAVIADYGAAGPARDVRAYRGHASADALDEPGTADITADVDFALLRQQAASAGFTALAETQEEFLLRHGVLDELNAVDRSSVEGASSYLRLRQLLLPTGLGAAFKVVRLDRTA